MLKPFKSLLTYLQRNANSSNIFGLTTMGPTEQPKLEETIMIANEDLVIEDEDPLYDPLALDDCSGTDTANVSIISLGSEDDEGTATGKIILVDMTTLKPKVEEVELETDDDEEIVPEGATADGEVVLITDGTDTSCELLLPDVEVDVESASTVSGGNRVISLEYGVNGSATATANDIDRIPLGAGANVEDIQRPIRNGGHYTDVVALESDGKDCVEAAESSVDQIQGANGGEEEEEASDGSDSGLGLEPSRNVSTCGSSNSSPLVRPPLKSSLKRRSDSSSVTTEATTVQEQKENGISSQKRVKKGITFDGVTVYYFPRIQGFGCVPSQGGCTLGMEFQHIHSRRLTLSEHSAEQRKVHKQQLQELNPRSSSSEDTSSDEEPSESGSEAESESYGFLQPVSTRQRRALLKAAGVRKIDSTEKDECREIRTSREVCGCTCRGFCDPNRCACSLAGIKCQVDRASFPCGCTHEGCANTAGRVEFNPARVRTHFMHTIMRLSMEERNNVIEARQAILAGAAAVNGTSGHAGPSESNNPGGNSRDGGYVMGSEKNWSNGPVRLVPGGMVVYGSGMHAATSAGSSDMADGMHHHVHALPQYCTQLPHHQPPIGMQDELHLTAPEMPRHQQPPYLNHLAGNVPHPSYLLETDNVPHPTDSLELHYGFQEYYGAVETTSAPGLMQHPSCAGSEPSVAPLDDLYYGGNCGDFGGNVASNRLVPYRQEQHAIHPESVLPWHTPCTDSATSARHHMLPTGHDRHPERSLPESHPQPPSLREDRADRANGESGVPRVPHIVASDPGTGSGDAESVFPCPFSSPSVVGGSAHDTDPLDDGVDVTINLDSSGELNVAEFEKTVEQIAPIRTSSPIVVEDDESSPSPPSDQSGTARPAVGNEISSFIDLTAPQAGNTERLEAINDLLESSRHTLSIVRRSVVAEEDDELRDFRHSPIHRPIEEPEGYGEDVASGSEGSPNLAAYLSGRPNGTPNGTDDCPTEAQPRKRLRYSSEEASETTVHRHLANGSTCSTGSHPPDELDVDPISGTNSPLPGGSPSSSSPASATSLEPSENLCEIIKNSIVETAVSH